MARGAVCCSMLATIRSVPPQWPQAFTSMPNTLLRRCAQVIERRFSSGLRWSLLAPVDSSSMGGRLPRPDVVNCARKSAFGAMTPWERVSWARCGGTSAASLAMNSTGSNSTCVVPFFHGVLSWQRTLPCGESDERFSEIAGRAMVRER